MSYVHKGLFVHSYIEAWLCSQLLEIFILSCQTIPYPPSL